MSGGGIDFSKGLWEGVTGGGDDTSSGSAGDASEILAPISKNKTVYYFHILQQ